jgi:hypothetical protein
MLGNNLMPRRDGAFIPQLPFDSRPRALWAALAFDDAEIFSNRQSRRSTIQFQSENFPDELNLPKDIAFGNHLTWPFRIM